MTMSRWFSSAMAMALLQVARTLPCRPRVGGDFNGDGKADIATASVDANGGLAIFLGNGNGTFGPPISSFVGTTGLNLGPMIAGDFNRDGKSDLVVVSENNV